mmetsp:Transcript_2634/g.7914  ORF Transcript_2634/g.7914 Transcript_2634/m.7914 type:complete len:95 (-) Transcript_2634:386-670(-)
MDDSYEELQRKRAKLEWEVEHRLKPDLDAVCGRRDAMFEEIMDLLQLQQNVLLLKDTKDDSIDMQVDVGENFFMQGEVTDHSHLIVDIGRKCRS